MSQSKNAPTQNYKVVILCYTYNQEDYIEDALQGFVRQQTTFPFCAVIVDDCSTDNNAAIVKRYEELYPDIIKGIYLPHNMFHTPEEKNMYLQPWIDSAEYLAICEGDDYWIDDYKLQRQVEILDSHPEYMLCFHNAIVRCHDHSKPDSLLSNFETGEFTTCDMFKKWQLPLASVVYRKKLIETKEFNHIKNTWNGGFAYFIASTLVGKAYGISEALSVYRKNNGGISTGWSIAKNAKINLLYAEASGDKASLDYSIDKYTAMLAVMMQGYLRGNQTAKELADVIRPYQNNVVKIALFKYIKVLFKRHRQIISIVIFLLLSAVICLSY